MRISIKALESDTDKVVQDWGMWTEADVDQGIGDALRKSAPGTYLRIEKQDVGLDQEGFTDGGGSPQ